MPTDAQSRIPYGEPTKYVPIMRLILTALRELSELVDEQAEDEALWALNLDGSLPISEAYLQQELRRLHAAVEAAVGVAKDALR